MTDDLLQTAAETLQRYVERPLFYILDGNRKPIPVKDMQKWSEWMKINSNKIIKKIQLNDITISTIFLGINHGSLNKNPVLFETMIFWENDPLDQWQDRYCSYQEAIHGHRNAVRIVIKQLRENNIM